jgi:FkbM family methyltransferase
MQVSQLRTTASRAGTLLAKNPALFCRLVAAKLNTARRLPATPLRKRIGSVEIEFEDRQYRGTAPMYFGSYAMPLVHAMRRYLKPGDVFIDVGANIGYISAVAADIVGADGQVHCFEPVARYFRRLDELARSNPDHKIFANFCAAGERAGAGAIYVTREAGQNTMVPGYKSGAEVESVQHILVVRLDEYFAHRSIDRVAMIKIDAEGFELPILKGLTRHFDKAASLPAIVCEIAPRAYSLMGRDIGEVRAFMERYGYGCFDVIDGKTPVKLEELREVQDVLFLSRR